MFCLRLSDGDVIWQKNVLEVYESPSGYFGAGSTPIVINDKLLVNVGGKDAAVVALDLTTGAEIWRAFDDRASYSSPIELKLGQLTDSASTHAFLEFIRSPAAQPAFEKYQLRVGVNADE